MNSNYLNQSYYQNVPSSQVNWAELAQRWIMAKAPPADPDIRLVPPNVLPPGFPPPLPPLGMRPPFPPPPGFMPPMPLNASNPVPPFFGNWPSDIPPMPPPSPFMPPGCFPPANAFQQNTENEEYKAHYDASLDQDDEAQNDGNNGEDSNGVPGGSMSHWFSEFDDSANTPQVLPMGGPPPSEWMMWGNMPPGSVQANFTPIIDNQMRKKLPAWILEGLEKAEKEKQKKLEKEEVKRRREEAEKVREAKRAQKGRGKFDSDTESDDGADEGSSTSRDDKPKNSKFSDKLIPLKPSTTKKDNNDGDVNSDDNENEHKLTLEERKQEALLAMRRLMTMVLLEATDHELKTIAKDCLAYAKRKARPKLLASSAALNALSAFGADDDEDEDDDAVGSSDLRSEVGYHTSSQAKTTHLHKSGNGSARHPDLTAILRPPTPTDNLPSTIQGRSSSPESQHDSSSSKRHHSSASSRHRSNSSSSSSSSSRHHSSHKSSRRSPSRNSSRRRFRESSSPDHRSSSSRSSSKKKKY